MSEHTTNQSSESDRSPGLRVQLWSYNYDPEPTGIGPVSTTLATALARRGHLVDVVAAHPHYPEPVWGKRRLPYREERDGIDVLRLPLWVGRATAVQRLRQEASFMASQFAALPALGSRDVAIVVSPSFPALLPAVIGHRLRRTPWILWLHDILPDGAAATGLLDEGGTVLRLSRKLEAAAYAAADRIVVLSEAFTENLRAKGVDERKIRLIYDPATRIPEGVGGAGDGRRILSMGNIGFSQGLAPLVAAFEAESTLDVKLIITGNGMAEPDVRREVRTARVEMLGVVDDRRLEQELQSASIGLVTQHHDGSEFNIPSKLMNFMIYGLPVLAAVNPQSEVARIVEGSGGGWVVDSGQPELLPAQIAKIVADQGELGKRGQLARDYAERQFTIDGFADRFDALIRETVLSAHPAEH
jgi:colanic acid biosynthesis glycosyl transferase WcaI